MRGVVVLFLLAIHPALAADDLVAGMKAYKRGDFAAALSLWQPLAEEGNSAAQYNIGRMHAYGEAVVQDFVEAYKWFLLASEGGRIEADMAIVQLDKRLDARQMAEAIGRVQAWKDAKN